MCDIFVNDIFSTIQPTSKVSYSLFGTKLPKNQDIYFIAKWHEIFERYCTARNFLRKTLEDDWSYWFDRVDDEKVQKMAELHFKGELYEVALLSYNILVDLSWTITYVSAEYALYKRDSNGNIINAEEIPGILSIEDAYEMLRKTENDVTTPQAKGNPFDYLKVMRPEFKEAIDLIIEFWSEFANSDIRNLYNYIKHKGKPVYKEVADLQPNRIFRLQIGDQQCASSIRDVQRIISIEDGINKLIEFDDNKLYPYIKKLIELLNIAVNPSPMVML